MNQTLPLKDPGNGKKILVTGGTGFIGGRLVEELVLRHGANVRVLVRNFGHAARLARFPVEMFAGDITDPQAVLRASEGCDWVFHCAFGTTGGPAGRYATTVEGTRSVIRAVLKNRLSRMVHMSTFCVYGNTGSGDLKEDAPRCKTGHLYSDSKLEAENLVMEYCKNEGLPATILQPTIVYGPYALSWTVGPLQELKTGDVVLTNGGGGLCHAVYVDDVVNAMILAAQSNSSIGECFLVSGAGRITWRDFYSAFQEILRVGSIVDMTPDEIRKRLRPTLRRKIRQAVRSVQTKSRIVDLFIESPLLKQPYRFLARWTRSRSNARPLCLPDEMTMNFHMSQTRVCIEKAQKMLGYSPCYDFAKGMELTAEWIRWANLA